MLTINDIKYPAYFHSHGNGTIRFEDRFNGKWDNGMTCYNLTVDHFIEMHNAINPENSERKDYFYYSPIDGYSIAKISDITKMIQSEKFNPSGWKISGIGKPFTAEAFETIKLSKVEDMPIGAKLLSIKNEDGSFDDVTFDVRRVEINVDIITLLSGYAGGYSKKANSYGLELNIKRGTIVRYKQH